MIIATAFFNSALKIMQHAWYPADMFSEHLARWRLTPDGRPFAWTEVSNG